MTKILFFYIFTLVNSTKDKNMKKLMIILSLLASFIVTGCTVEVTSAAPEEEFCYADYECSWYNEYGVLRHSWLCAEEITKNMTCKIR